MTSNGKRRLTRDNIQSDHNVVVAIRDLHDYAPFNQEYSLAALEALEAELSRAQQEERRAQNALDAARDKTIAAAYALHRAARGAKSHVIAQYGPEANAVQALGLKKRSEYRRPTRKRVPAES